MTTRTFEFSEGTSNKFWAITLDGSSHTVRYGRIGTAGQSLTANFTSEAEAKKSHDKLVAEKVKKGYLEKNGDGAAVPAAPASAPAPAPTPAPAPAAARSTPKPAPPPAAKPAEPARPVDTSGKFRRHIDFEIADLSYIPARRAAPKPLAPAEPFDLEDCLERLRTKVKVKQYGWEWDFSRAIPVQALSREEAEFWLAAMDPTRDRNETAASVAEKLGKRSFRGQSSEPVNLSGRFISPMAMLCFSQLASPDEMLNALLDSKTSQGPQAWDNNSPALRIGFRKYVLPYLDDAAIARWREAARHLWDPSDWPADFYKTPAPAFYFGAMLGLHDEVRALVELWADDLYMSPSWDHTHYHRPQEVVCGAGSAEQVEFQFRRLKLPTNTPNDILTFLSVTEVSALDVVARTIANTGKREDAEELFEVFSRIHAPEAAPYALDLVSNSKVPKAAREWLESNLDESIVGLMPVAAGTGKLAEAAVEFLGSVKRRGQAAQIEAHLDSVDSQVAARVRETILDVEEVQIPVLPADATPSWWTEAMTQSPPKKSKPLAWPQPTDLPTLTVGEHALGTHLITELLAALQSSTLESPHPLLRALREHAARDRLDEFGWKIFQGWLAEGAPPKEKWAFFTMGLLGSDRTVLRLAPLVRAWPGESQHARAVLGLEVLRTIGTDTALMQINGIAQKVKFKGLKERAIQCMDEIAAGRGMSRAELEDRIVPDCGLDERGERVFDFGPRQFRFVLGPELKPMIRYPDGATKPDLPKPGAKDDAAKAEPVVAEWKLLKKQIADVAKIQAVRLEQAMVTGRRWSAEEFTQLLVRHSLMVHLVRRLLWATYGADGAVTSTFRVTEDQTFADAKDQAFLLPKEARVGVLHPLQVAEQTHVLEQWGQLFGDYEIIAPFPQLGRPSFRLTPEQLAKKEITHFETRGKLPAQTLVFGLEKRGWQRGVPADAGWVGEHSKQFYGSNVTALINYEEGFSVGYWEGAGEQTIKSLSFVPGLYTPQMYPDHKNALRLADVDPIALSEVLGDCEALLEKAQ